MIVLTGLFVVGAILFFGWKKVLPKILPKSWLSKINLGINLNEDAEDKIKSGNEKDENNPENDKDKDEHKLGIL